MKPFLLLLILPVLVPQPEPLPVVFRYFDQNALYKTYLGLSANSPLDPQLKEKVKRGLSTTSCKAGLLEVELDAKLAQEWKRQLSFKECPENCPSARCEKCKAKDIRDQVRAALYNAFERNTVCNSETQIRPPL